LKEDILKWLALIRRNDTMRKEIRTVCYDEELTYEKYRWRMEK
jgi:hypothetical protein